MSLTLAATSDPGPLAIADFDQLAAFIQRVTGIKTPRSKHSMIEGRLRRRVIESGAGNFEGYCAHIIRNGEDCSESLRMIDAVTTNKTDFFREPEHFRIFRDVFLETLPKTQRHLKIWSAGCSTGAEPYSLAMVASDFMQTRPGLSLSILATDICTSVLETARIGIYPSATIAPVSKPLRARFVRRAKDPALDAVRIVPSLRAMLRFGRLNLIADNYPVDPDFDAIFCRNVLIYFDRSDQEAVLLRFCRHLRPGGLLAIGHSETINGLKLPLEAIGHTMFRRT